MKKRILALILTLVMLVACFTVITVAADNTDDVADQIVLSVGKDETERSLAWFSEMSEAGEVRLTEAENVVDGAFPSVYKTFAATSVASDFEDGKYSKKATLTGLSENTRYAYVFAVGEEVSNVYYFDVGSFGDFDFVFIADPQLIEVSDGEKWKDSLDKITNNLKPDLILSGGDQVNTKDSTDLYNAFIIDEMAGVTFAPSVGPGHEESPLYSEHYNLPNLSSKYGSNSTSSNYWYVYNNVLFMNLNSSDRDAFSDGEHIAFIKEAMAANPDVDWKVVITHYSLYSTGIHGEEMEKYRIPLAPKLTELGVDLVLTAHDHVYVRTHLMDGLEVSGDLVVGDTAYNPEGTLYVECNSVSGTKFYSQKYFGYDWIAKDDYKHKCAIKFEVTETALSMKSYYLDDMTVFDTFTIDKTEPESFEDIELNLEGIDVTLTDGVNLNFYVSSNDTLLGISNATLVEKNGKACYKLTAEVAAKEMGDDVTVQLMHGDIPVGKTFTYSVKEYAEGILDGEYDDVTKELVRAMLNYGAAAQNYWSYETDSLVGTPVTDTTALKSADIAGAVIDGDGFIGATLVLEGSMRLRLYFKGNDLDVAIKSKALTVTNKGKYCYADIRVTPFNIDKIFGVKVGDDLTVKYSVLNYLKNNADNEALTEIVASIYAYSVASKAYGPGPISILEELQRDDISVYEYPLDKLEEVKATVAYNTDKDDIANYYVFNDGKTISYLIDITDTTFDSIHIEQAKHANPYIRFAFFSEKPVYDQPAPYAEGYCTYKAAWTFDFTVDIPEDAKYLIIAKMDGEWDCTPTKMTFTKGTKALENIQNEELDTYEYPIENLVFDHGVINDGWWNNKHTNDAFIAEGDCKVAIIDIRDCAFDYVSLYQDSSFKKQLGWTFLEELPEWKKVVSYAGSYTGFKWSEDNADKDGNIHTEKNIAIPTDANYLVLYYMESYYEEGAADWRYYPNSIIFHDTKK